MKYIDSEKLIAEIERRESEINSQIAELGNFESNEIGLFNYLGLYDDILSFITSLQQEQPEVDLEQFISDFFDKKDAENNGRWSEDDIMEAITQAFELGQRTKYQQDRAEFAKLKAKEWTSGYHAGYAKGLTARKGE